MKLMIPVSNTFYRKILNTEHILKIFFVKWATVSWNLGFLLCYSSKAGTQAPFKLAYQQFVFFFSCIDIFEIFSRSLRYTNIYCNFGPFLCVSFPFTLLQPTLVADKTSSSNYPHFK